MTNESVGRMRTGRYTCVGPRHAPPPSTAPGRHVQFWMRSPELEQLAMESGSAGQVDDPGTHPWLSAMFAYYDEHGLPVGTRVLEALLGRRGVIIGR